ncbi:hypothetical protein BXZ70DRAFT_949037 [Cristinia sonorae]|uniref:ATP-dependent DNA ligase family profile domain-containing protein n=1 Tax=Cristinia sonorae TaxID=1940300 RepID=A0A8K0UK11_9AGAR|nr:hypothetical protein BXZ70DRAFT_949037 [Cristinia sonorae]
MDVYPEDTSIPFSFFASLLREISTIPRKKKTNPTRRGAPAPSHQTFQNWVNELRRVYPSLAPGTTATIFRLLFPEEDVVRKYGMQETTLARYLADILRVSTSSDGRGQNLVNWNAATATGCLGSEVETVMQLGEHDRDSSVTVHEIDRLLTELAATCAYSSAYIRSAVAEPRSKREVLIILFCSLSSDEAAFLVQIILKDLRPVLYPLQETHFTASLLQYNSNAVMMITVQEAMKIWDPSLKMIRAYRVRATLEAASDIFEDPNASIEPQLGVPISIPKCVKGQGCAHAIKLLRHSSEIWAETKYDGERAQIHVQVDENLQSHITIFSKSRRDSTLDRAGIHHIIREALDLPQRHADPGDSEQSKNSHGIKNIVLEAEMVAYSDALSRIDEFWRIRSLIASTAMGVRHSSVNRGLQNSDDTQNSMISNASDGGTRHLALVFFDVLVLNSESILHKPYSDRRALLESLITASPGHSMLAARFPISLRQGVNQAADELSAAFAKMIADHQEGLVLKAEDSRYNDWKFPWIKLKKDYIPGHGDTVDVVIIGASWNKDRARELGVAPTVFTTFYLGLTQNADEAKADPSVLPAFACSFVVSYGLSREGLEDLNFMIRASDLVNTASVKVATPYTCGFSPGLGYPAVMLSQPLVAEVFGAGFTKSSGSKYYELRFPRISKVYRPSERSWKDAVTLEEFQKIGRQAIGLDRPGKTEEDWCNQVWGKVSSPSVNSAVKRKRREEEWFEKLQRAEGRSSTRRRTGPSISENPLSADSSLGKDTVMMSPQAMTPRTNLAVRGKVTDPAASLTPPPSSPLQPPMPLPNAEAEKANSTSNHATLATVSPPGMVHQQPTVMDESSLPSPAVSQRGPGIPASLSSFLKDAVVYFSRPADTKRPIGRTPSREVVPLGQQLNTLESFMLLCRWTQTNLQCSWAEKGVVFVDDTSEQWLTYPMATLLERRSAISQERGSFKLAGIMPIYVLSLRILERGIAEDVVLEQYCLCKLA